MNQRQKADLMLILVALSWGFSYYFVDLAMMELGSFTLNAYRFFVAFGIAFLFSFPQLKSPNKTTLLHSLGCGFLLFLVYIGANMGVKYTTLSNTGFLASMTVIFTPIFAFLYYRRVPKPHTFLSVILCFIGICLLTLGDGFTINMKNFKGDIASILCAICYANHLLFTEYAVKKKTVDAYQLSVYQFFVCGLLNVIAAFIWESPILPSSGKIWAATLFLSVFCTGMAFVVQAIAQKFTTATRVGIIFSLEPVFAGIVAFIFAGERLGLRAYIGAFLMVTSIFIMELAPIIWKKRRV
ncbi:MAG: DMT family transporter [Tissierellia bacterium]|nr:DMT family transporter [Tissierellia bacterium]